MTVPSPQIRVTIEDIETGDKEVVVLTDDYVLICAGSAEQTHVQAYGSGTHVITVKGLPYGLGGKRR